MIKQPDSVKARLKYSDGRENTWDKIPQQDYIKKNKALQDRFSTVWTKTLVSPLLPTVLHLLLQHFFPTISLALGLKYSVHLGHSLPHTRVLPYSNLHVSPLQGMSCLSLQITVSYANVIAHKEPCLTSSVSLSVSITNKQGAQGQTLMHFYLHLELFCHT